MNHLTMERSGIKWLHLEMERSKEHGVLFTVQADPRIEEYFKELSQGQLRSISLENGHQWFRPDGKPLATYRVPEERYTYATSFYLGLAGFPFHEEDDERQNRGGSPKVNLSFIHLEGLTEGLTFAMKVPISWEGMDDLKTKIGKGIREFIKQYLTTVKMVLEVVSYESK